MSNAAFSPETYVDLVHQHPSWSNQRIADELGVSEASVRRGLHKANYERHLIPLEGTERHLFKIDTPLRVRGPAMITADWHIPLYDPTLANEMISTARAQGLDQLIVGGDFFNNDALSQYDPKQQDAGFEREHREALSVMQTLLETFKTIYYIWGNHDARLHKALGFKMQFKLAMQAMFGELGTAALDRIVFSNLDHLWLEPYPDAPRDLSWYVCHPRNYSRLPLTAARALAAKHNCNIITAHSHHCAVSSAANGRHVVIEAGGLFDSAKTAYLQATTTFPEWTQGYVWIDVDNMPHVRSPLWRSA